MTKVDVSKQTAYTVVGNPTDELQVKKLTAYVALGPVSGGAAGPVAPMIIII